MPTFLQDNKILAWILAAIAFGVAIVLILKIIEIAVDLRRRIPGGSRSRQLRLGFVETFDLDGERQLLLVRRDNVEHLLMIGGPNDVLVESGIVRVEPREARAPRSAELAIQANAHGAAPVQAPTPGWIPAPPPAAPLPAPSPELAAAIESAIAAARPEPDHRPAPTPASAPRRAQPAPEIAPPPAPETAPPVAPEQEAPQPAAPAPAPERPTPRFPLPPRVGGPGAGPARP